MMKYLSILMVLVLTACGGGAPTETQPSSDARVAHSASAVAVAAPATNPNITIAGYRASYQVNKNWSDGSVVLTNISTLKSTTYPAVMSITFADKVVTFDASGIPGQAYRLYQAAFNRKPDLEGLGYWISNMQNGMSLVQVSQNFTLSQEFKDRYGAVNPGQFVTLMYNNVLHRAPETAGYNYWLANMNAGMDEPHVLLNFSESTENIDNLAGPTAGGIEYVPFGKILVKKSSYENKITAEAAVGPVTKPVNADATAFGNFFGDGKYSMVLNTLEYDVSNPATANQLGHIHFYQLIDGAWVDHTSTLLADNTGCLHPRKALVADFNGDGKPDIFFSCHGFDAAPWTGEQQRMLLSQPDGTYKNVIVPITCYCHSASAVDFDGNGFASLLVADQNVAHTPYFMINNKDGTFSQDKTRLPANLLNKQIYTAELIDFSNTGKYDAFLAGSDVDGSGYNINPTIFTNDGTNNFKTTQVTIPVQRSAIFTAAPVTLDIVFDSGNIYLLRTDYHAEMIQKTNYAATTASGYTIYSTLAASDIYDHAGSFNGQSWMTWFPWMAVYKGALVSTDANYAVNLPK